MANLVSVQNVSLAFGGDPLLDGVSLNIEKGDHICLVGRNGCGKSSFLKILDGSLEPDSGEIVRAAGLRVASLPQDVALTLEGTVGEVVGATAPSAASATSAISRLGLSGETPFAALSGGQRRRCLLARAIASEPDLLILDEPTNHLDIPTIEWLESFLENRVQTFVFVTHDRAFLRRLARRIVDLDRGKLAGWDCDYDTFLRRKEQLIEDENTYYERLGKNIRREEAWLRRGVKARTARNEGRVNALMALRREFAQRRTEEGQSTLKIHSAGTSGTRVMRIRDLTFAYPGGKPLVSNFSAEILRGERIALIGPNGAGKTTLVRLLLGELKPTSGEIDPGTNLRIVYFDQLRQKLNPDLSVADNVSDGNDNVNVAGHTRHVLSYLSDFLFTPERARTPVRALSGGERGRLMLARLFLEPCNFLILDEPTNDLDMETLELLEDQLAAFSGTIVLVSHDRDFIDNTAVTSWFLGPDGIVVYPGGYSDGRKLFAAAREKAGVAARQESAAPAPEAPRKRADNRLSYKERREYEALPGQIEALEAEEAELNERLCDPEIYKKPQDSVKAWRDRLAAIPAETERLMARWAELEERA
ncbi:MAG: ATP-binding cassette domain-containing protein [Kiritimatiellae bacterium]|nr:ATP-binding cassette domain-containing protein [Kiritimatiellia bacterium]